MIGGTMKKNYYKRLLLSLLLFSVILDISVLISKSFSDFYAKNIFPFWVSTLGRFTSLFPISVGEIMLLAGLTLLTAAILLGLVLLFSFLFARQKNFFGQLKKIAFHFYRAFALILTCIYLVLTLNCFMLYRTSTFHEMYYFDHTDDYHFDNLVKVRNYVVAKVNQLSGEMERDSKGNIIYDGDLEQTSIAAMKQLGKEFDRLDGYYPRPKKLLFSGFLSQQYMCGYYFPFSMEANYNAKMYIPNMPSTITHELSHVKGFLLEDEANFIGFLACIGSEDVFFQYSGYLSVLNYLDNYFYDVLDEDKQRYRQYPAIAAQVRKDNIFLTEDAWEDVEKNALLDTKLVSRLADEFIEKTLVLNGVEDGALSYNRVIWLLFDYYSEKGLF
jgi:hypothetical protein